MGHESQLSEGKYIDLQAKDTGTVIKHVYYPLALIDSIMEGQPLGKLHVTL